MKLASIRSFRSGISGYTQKGIWSLLRKAARWWGAFFRCKPRRDTDRAEEGFCGDSGGRLAGELSKKKIQEKEILNDFREFRKLATDSNVILSAVIGKAALQVFLRPEIELITTRFNVLEVEEYIPRLVPNTVWTSGRFYCSCRCSHGCF